MQFKVHMLLISFLSFLPFAFAESRPWEFLKPLSDFAVSASPIVKPIVFLFALALFAIAMLAYLKTKSKKMLFITIAFGFFAVKWAIKLVDLFASPGFFFSDASE